MAERTTFSIVILTFNRRDCLQSQLEHLRALTSPDLDIIVVDNCSTETVDDLVATDPRARVIRNPENMGAVGRNSGMRAARGDIVVTLDDDVYGINDEELDTLAALFAENPRLGAVNFSVKDELSDEVTAWCHPRDLDTYWQEQFPTNHISEGAVAFRNEALRDVGYYPDHFFISHEGPDLAYRLIRHRWELIYSPSVVVIHTYELKGRPGWRRYYYDTRNQLWLAVRNLGFFDGFVQVFISWGSLFVYSVRDGFLRYWFKAVRDAVRGLPAELRARNRPDAEFTQTLRHIERLRPSFLSRVRRRLGQSGVKG